MAQEYIHLLATIIEIKQDLTATIVRGVLVLEKPGEEGFQRGVEFWSSARSTSPDVTTVFHIWAYGGFTEIQIYLRRRKPHGTN